MTNRILPTHILTFIIPEGVRDPLVNQRKSQLLLWVAQYGHANKSSVGVWRFVVRVEVKW